MSKDEIRKKNIYTKVSKNEGEKKKLIRGIKNFNWRV